MNPYNIPLENRNSYFVLYSYASSLELVGVPFLVKTHFNPDIGSVHRHKAVIARITFKSLFPADLGEHRSELK